MQFKADVRTDQYELHKHTENRVFCGKHCSKTRYYVENITGNVDRQQAGACDRLHSRMREVTDHRKCYKISGRKDEQRKAG